jgi:hypothetical protein
MTFPYNLTVPLLKDVQSQMPDAAPCGQGIGYLLRSYVHPQARFQKYRPPVQAAFEVHPEHFSSGVAG